MANSAKTKTTAKKAVSAATEATSQEGKEFNKARQQYLEEVAAKKQEIDSKVSEWSEDDLEAHLEKIANIYQTRKTADKLGKFDWDLANVYYWHTYDGNPEKLHRRQSLGWGFATREDARKSGLTTDLLSDLTVDGETCVEMSHKSHRAVLLKIPRELFDINEKVRERIRNNRPVTDADGKLLNVETTESQDKVVGQRRENMIQIR